ncbi:helix-turn-helix domain-containing protein [bacterium]|nr:helix-turn-helix domain-containing protein [bacterium]
MVKEVGPVGKSEKELDEKAMKVFLKTLDLLGGPRKLFEYRNLTWLPSLMEASYVVVMFEDGKTSQEIAEALGLSTNTVRNILNANPEVVKAKLKQEVQEEGKKIKTHIAGGLAKLAYQALKK